MDVGLLAQYVTNALMLGMMYALVAVGFTLFFGVLDIIKFSHGDVLTVGAFTALATYVGLSSAGVSSSPLLLLAMLVVAILAMAALGMLISRYLVMPLRSAPALNTLLITLMLGTVLRELVRLFYPQGANPKPFPALLPTTSVNIGNFNLRLDNVLMLAAGGLGQIPVVQLGGALAGACAGFLLFNWHPAKIFMGDSGAHFLGAALGVISILGLAKVAVAFALAVPVLALAVPIADTAWAILRRGRRGTSLAHADLGHLHHRLQSIGLDPRQTCFVIYTASAVMGAVGLTLLGHGRILAVVIATCAVLVSTVAADLLLHTGWRIPAPFLRRLLADQGSR